MAMKPIVPRFVLCGVLFVWWPPCFFFLAIGSYSACRYKHTPDLCENDYLLDSRVLLLSAAPTLAQTHAFTGAHIIPIDGPEIENGTLIIEDGRIVDVGPAGQVDVPRRAERHDVKGMVIMPGLVDTHSHIGDGSGADRSAPIQPDVRVMDSINPRDSGFQKAQSGGVTTANIMPGSGHLLSGQTLYVKYRDADIIDDLLILDEGRQLVRRHQDGQRYQPSRGFPFSLVLVLKRPPLCALNT